jgi:hypothetical protein
MFNLPRRKEIDMDTLKSVDTQALLELAIDAARQWEGDLSGQRKGKGQAQAAFEALRRGRIELGNPQAHTLPVRPKDFKARNLDLSPEIKQSMSGADGYAFYLVPVPVLLFPGRGAQYRLLESQMAFKGMRGARQPAIHAIFPEQLWQTVLTWGGKLHLGLDGNLKWGAEVEQTELKIGKLGGELAGMVKNKNQIASFIKLLPFEHTLGRMEIEAQFSSGTAMWRLDNQKVIRGQKHVQLVVLLKVPKEIHQVQVEAAAQAEVSFDWLTAQVSHVFERLPDTIQQIIKNRKGLPLQDFQTWDLQLAQ